MAELIIWIQYLYSDDTIGDPEYDYSLLDFAGILPSIGDQILHPDVLAGHTRSAPGNRVMLTVAGRVFNPRDRRNCISLLCESRTVTEDEVSLLPPG